MNTNLLRFENDHGLPMQARLLTRGMAYGQYRDARWALEFEGMQPVVEIYDERFAHTPHGQFVSRYLLETLASNKDDRGIQLEGGVPAWCMSAANVRSIVETFTPLAEQFLAQQAQGLTLLLSNRGNPDHGENPRQPMFHAPDDVWVPVASFAHASALSRHYIDQFGLGGGNWAGGAIKDARGKAVGRIAYNGRVFDLRGQKLEEPARANEFAPLDIESLFSEPQERAAVQRG